MRNLETNFQMLTLIGTRRKYSERGASNFKASQILVTSIKYPNFQKNTFLKH